MHTTPADHYGDHDDGGEPDDDRHPQHHTTADHRGADHHSCPAAHHGAAHHLHPATHDDRTMSALATLLELQEHDVSLDQLRHRRASLPERAELAGLTKQHDAIAAELASVADERDTVVREQKRLEDEVALLAAKATAEDKKLYSGTVTAPKELQAIQDEIKALDRRRTSLEDEILVQMETCEPLDETIGSLRSQLAALDESVTDARGRLQALEGVIDADVARLQGERDQLAAAVELPLLRQYDELRRRLGGVAVARLEGSSCRGCHLQLAAVELGRIRKLDPDEVVHCEECGRILVR